MGEVAMTSGHQIVLDLPPELHAQVTRIAKEQNRPVETVLLEMLRVVLGTPDSGALVDPAVLADYTDEQLWGVIHQRLAWPDRERYRELVARAKRDDLSPDEQRALDALVEQMDRYTVLRSQALLLLQRRGHNISAYFGTPE